MDLARRKLINGIHGKRVQYQNTIYQVSQHNAVRSLQLRSDGF